ncbi:MAG: amino acid ABC transporter substrate-binding protein, partial [Flavobacteriales bacterium]|nr:amino acid ABC transporter substrate-binding protein [Flavobacteriales bacterium]
LGFDIGFYYMSMLLNHGSGFVSQLETEKHKGILSSFDFYKTGFDSGYENNSVSILRYVNYRLTRVE